MKKLTTQDSETKSTDIIKWNIAELKTLFPEALTEGNVDLNVLKQLLGGKVDETEEKYGLNWLGKRRSRQIALTPSSGTLRPCPGDSVDWETTQNLMIEGDNLEVLKLLQKSYARKVKLIYIDPPYNTGSDFVYPDDFQDNIKNYLMRTGQMESDGRKNTSNTEASGRWHTDWLNMMYPRLRLARNLLRDDGMIFISIDDNEIANLRKMCDDIFGEENYRNMVVIRRGAKSVQAQFNTWDKLGSGYEFILIYSKCSDYRFPQMRRPLDETRSGSWNNHWRGTDRPTMRYQLLGITPETGQWRWSQSRSEIAVRNFQEMLSTIGKTEEAITQEEIDTYYMERIDDDLDFIRLSSNGNPEHYVPPSDSVLLNDIWFDLPTSSSKEVLALFEQKKVFDNPKQTRLVQRILDFADKDAVVLDFFAGSGTTGHAVMAQNANDNGMRRYILIQLPEALNPQENGQKIAANFCDKLAKPHNIAELTKERLRRTAKKIRDEAPLFMGDLGFRVFKLDSSNIRAWEPDRDNLAATLEAHAEHIKTDRTEQDILFELLLKLGLDLTVPIEHKTIAGKTVHSIGAGTLIVCLDTQITSAEVEPLSLGIVEWHQQLAPAGEVQIVFRDSAFADDVSKTNLTAILDQYGLENVRSL
ncbi:DNA methylase [Dehalogenimonas alkenigignens]|uniref:DNA methylase n=1 Tax=Dehalogenimonas alkenigignens TaxID=1217799 RepID=A0A0W0GKA0_9CHLR|nr:site-specific DNA-methyltransferase [Dehalogenimonas alkenigignens]KTB48968.1 DNA methylase [Dehalogenimonas alkenigignens]